MKIAILGISPAGAYLASVLAQGHPHHQIYLIDPQRPWERPMGISTLHKSLSEFLLLSHFKKSSASPLIRFIGPCGSVSEIPYSEPLFLSPRHEVTHFLQDLAVRCGVERIAERVKGIDYHAKDQEWRVQTPTRDLVVDYLVGADGAASFVQQALGQEVKNGSLTLSAGYTLPQTFQQEVSIIFLRDVPGYLWSVPQGQGSAVGIVASGPGLRADYLFRLLDNFVTDYLGVPIPEDTVRQAGLLPSFRTLKKADVVRERLALIGEAARLVDPITMESTYYGMKSAALLARALQREDLDSYWEALKKDLLPSFQKVAGLKKSFYKAERLDRLVAKAGQDPKTQETLLNFVSGKKDYKG